SDLSLRKMMMSSVKYCLGPAGFALLIATAAIPCNAAGTNAYWHGVINNEWTVGIDSSTGLSNWYSQPPPNGTAQEVPTGTAKFEPGAKVFAVHVSADAHIG